jgi:hypothetical protein
MLTDANLAPRLMVDIKTDWNYPNALRPRENPGYKTKVTGKGKDA